MNEDKVKALVDENFQGLAEFINDKEIFEWYKSLIVTCIKENTREAYGKIKVLRVLVIIFAFAILTAIIALS